MNQKIGLVLALLSLVSSFCRAENLDEMISSLVSKHVEYGELVGAVTLVGKNGEILDLQAHGVKDLESKEPVKTDTIFKIHSFTKAITCAGALMLFDEGKFQFSDPVSKYLPEFGDVKLENGEVAKNPILVSHLFTHTSGIGYENREVFESKSLDELSKKLAKKPIAFEPGTEWKYGMSIDVIGRLIEVWSGQRFEDFLNERIISPLGMVDTAFYVPEEKQGRMAAIYKVDEENGSLECSYDKENKKVTATSPDFCMPGGGLYSTATDYFRFLRMIMSNGEWDGKKYLKPETVKLMLTNQMPEGSGWVKFGKEIRDGFGYGYGFNVVTQKSTFDPDAEVGECGWGGKASCHYWFHPESGICVVTLEQIVPYRWLLERILKEPIYRELGKF